MAVLNAIFPLFAIIALGFAAVRSGYVSRENIRPMADLVIRIALPALIFLAVSTAAPGQGLNLRFLAGYAVASLLAFGVVLGLARRFLGLALPQAAIAGLGASGSNSSFMGYPIVLAMIGPAAGGILAQVMVVENLLMIPLALVLSAVVPQDAPQSRGAVLRQIGGNLIRNPLIIGLVAGLLVAAVGVPLPAAVRQTFEMLARMSGPAALFIIGGTLASLPVGRAYGGVALVVGGKLILHPLAVFAALSMVPGLDPVLLAGGVLFAAAPMLSVYPLFGEKVGLTVLTASALFAATVASAATISVTIHLLGLAGG